MTMTNFSTMSDSLVLFSSDDEESDSHYESKQYENFTSMLKGVPPPTSITISKFTVEEMLQKYKENLSSYGFGLEAGSVNLSSSKNPVPFLKYTNSSQISENIASLVQKVQERYVQMETMSSCNIWLKATLESCGSAKKRLRMRQGIGLSPGRRLSHLARRRQFFSSANLQRLANTENIRQIEIKKKSNLGNGRKKMARVVESEKLKSSKRALFLSPENGTPTKYGNTVSLDRKIYSSGSEERKKLPLQERSKKVEVLRWLSQQNFETDFPRKRLREECANSVGRKTKCPRRSLNFADDDTSSNVATSESNVSTDKKTSTSGKLSEIHKNKLLWAVSVVLRENNITRNHEHFKGLAAKLFFTCRTNLDEILSMNTAEGTSDKILHFARKIIGSVFEEFGIKVSPENKAENTESKINGDSKEELKENINTNNVDNQDRASNCPDDNNKFVFKTPNKVRQKRVVKSCQKAPNSGSKRKKNVMRRWRSLELLIEDAVLSSTANFKDDIGKEKNCVPVEDAPANEPIPNSEISMCNDDSKVVSNAENDGSFCAPADVIPRLPFVDTSVVFSPIPSSVQEESENVLYPSLTKHRNNMEESEVLSDENISQGTDDSMEVLNQDEDLEKGGMFAKEYLMKYGDGRTVEEETVMDKLVENPVALSPIEKPQDVTEGSCVASAVNTDGELLPEGNETQNDDTRTELSHDGDYKAEEDVIETENKEKDQNNDGNTEEWQPVTPEYIPGTYKPRKLVVKKSKPNWKVVRKNSEEAENESELRLKMRLSHEWEIVCRNSSCSDIGNNSEYESTSMNCSQMSGTTDKEVSSEYEVEDSSRRNSQCDESTDEGVAEASVLSERNDEPQLDSNQNFHSNSCMENNDQSRCDEIVEKPLTPTESPRFSQCDNAIQSDEDNNSSHREQPSDNINVEVNEHQADVITSKVRENEDEKLSSNTEQIRDSRARSACSDEENAGDNSPVLFENGRSGEKSRKGKHDNNLSSSPEAVDYYSSKRRRESQYDSESGNSSSSNGPEKKKKSLSLENYKARKLEEASNTKQNPSSEQSESRDVSSDEKSSGCSTTKKIYNIRLKHPIGHRKHKSKHRHKKENKLRHTDRKKSDPTEDAEPETDDATNTALQLQSLRQFLDSFCDEDSPEKVDGDEPTIPNTQGTEVNIQTIIDALSTLSNLVEEQIKVENGKMAAKEENGSKKRKNWLDVVSSWCGKNLKNLKLMPNTSSLSIEGLDDGSMAAMKKVLNLSMSQPSDLVSTVQGDKQSVSSDNGVVNPLSINSLKTEPNPVQDCTGSAPIQQTNLAVTNPALVNANMSSIRQTNDFQHYSMYSNSQCIGSQSNEHSFNYSEPFSAFSEVPRENVGLVYKDPRVSFDGQQAIQKLQDPRCSTDSWSRSHHRGASADYGTVQYASNGVEYPSIQPPYQYPSIPVQKPTFYQPNIYGNYQNWQMQGDVGSWNYSQGTMNEGYQNSAFYPFQMSNVSYYINKY